MWGAAWVSLDSVPPLDAWERDGERRQEEDEEEERVAREKHLLFLYPLLLFSGE